MNEPWNLELNEQICSSEDSFIDIEEKDSFDYLVGKLKEHEQEILILRFRVGYTFQDIADIKEKPLATITTTYYRALEKLKILIESKNFE